MSTITKRFKVHTAQELMNEFQLINHRIKAFTIYEAEEDGIMQRFITVEYYKDPQKKRFMVNESAKMLALASLARYQSKETLGLVESYECNYDYLNNTFVESASYLGSSIDSHHERVSAIKEKLIEIKAQAEQLHFEQVTVNQLAIHDGKAKRSANFTDAIQCLIDSLEI